MANNIYDPNEQYDNRVWQGYLEEKQKTKELNNAISGQIQRDPNIPISDNNDYADTARYLLNQYASSGTQKTREDTKRFIESNDLLRTYFKFHPESLDSYVDQVVERSNQVSRGDKPSYNPELGDVDPTTQISGYNTTGNRNALLDTIKDIGLSADALIDTVTGGNFQFSDQTVRNREQARLMRDISSLGSNVNTGMAKLKRLQQLQEEADRLSHIANGYTPEGRDAQTRLNNVQSLITTISNGITDTEKYAIKVNGSRYVQLHNELNYLQSLDGLDPRYASDYFDELDDAQWEKQKSLEYKNPTMLNPSYAVDYIGRQFRKVIKNPIKTASEILPWMAIGAVQSVPVLNVLVDGILASGQGLKNIDEATKVYFNQYGTTDGFSKLQAGLAGAANYACNLYAGRLALDAIPESVIRGFKKEMGIKINQTIAELNKAISPEVANAMGQSLGNAYAKSFFQKINIGTMVNTLGKYINNLGTNAMTKAVDNISGKAFGIIDKTKYGIGKVLHTVGNTLESNTARALGNTVGSLGVKGGTSMAIENATAEVATQLGNQTGLDADQVLKAGAQGIPAGIVGSLMGLGAKPITAGVKEASNFIRGDQKYKLNNKDLAEETTYINQNKKDKPEEVGNYLIGRLDSIENTKKYIRGEINNLEKKLAEVDSESRKGKSLQAKIATYKARIAEYDNYGSRIQDEFRSLVEDFHKDKDPASVLKGDNLLYKYLGYKGLLSRDAIEKTGNEEVAEVAKKYNSTISEKQKKAIKDLMSLTDTKEDIDKLNTIYGRVTSKTPDEISKNIIGEEANNALNNLKKYGKTYADIEDLNSDNVDKDTSKTLLKDLANNDFNSFHTNLKSRLDAIKSDTSDKAKKEKDILNKLQNTFDEKNMQSAKDTANSKVAIETPDDLGLLTKDETDRIEQSLDNHKVSDKDKEDIRKLFEEEMKSKDGISDSSKEILLADRSKEFKEAYKAYSDITKGIIERHNRVANSLTKKAYESEKEARKAIKDSNKTLKEGIDYIIEEKEDSETGKKEYYINKGKEYSDNLKKFSEKIATDDKTSVKEFIDNLSDSQAKKDFTNEVENLVLSKEAKEVYKALAKQDPRAKTLSEINTIDDFLKLDKIIQNSVIRYLVNKKKSQQSERIKQYQSIVGSEGIYGTDTFNMSGYEQALKSATNARVSTDIANLTKQYKESVQEVLENVGLGVLTELNYASRKDPELQKSLIESLDNLGLFDLTKALSQAKDIAEGKVIIQDFFKNNFSLINSNRVDQLRKIFDYLGSLSRMSAWENPIGSTVSLQTLHKAIGNLLYIIDKEGLEDTTAKDTSYFFEKYSSETWKDQGYLKGKRQSLEQFNKICSDILQIEQSATNNMFSQHLDFTTGLSELLIGAVDSNFLDETTKLILSNMIDETSNDFFYDLPKNFFKIDKDKLNKVYELLALTYTRDGTDSKSSTVVIDYANDTNLKNSKAKEFLLSLKDKTAREISDAFKELAKNEKETFSAVVMHLLTQPNVLAELGLLKTNGELTATNYKKAHIEYASGLKTIDEISTFYKELSKLFDAKNSVGILNTILIGLHKSNKVDMSTATHMILVSAVQQMQNNLKHDINILNDLLENGFNKLEKKGFSKETVFNEIYDLFTKVLSKVKVDSSGNFNIGELNKIIDDPKYASGYTGIIGKKISFEEFKNFIKPSIDFAKNILRNNIGNLYILDKLIKGNLIDSLKNTIKVDVNTYVGKLEELKDLFKLYNAKLPKYNSHRTLTIEELTSAYLNEYRQVLLNHEISRDDLNNYAKSIKLSATDQRLWDEYYQDLFNKNGHLRDANEDIFAGHTNMSTKAKDVLAKVLGMYINANNIENTYTTKKSATERLTINSPKESDIITDNIKKHHSHKDVIKEGDLKKKGSKSLFRFKDAINSIKQVNSNWGPELSDLLDIVDELSRIASVNFVVDSQTSSHQASKFESVNGRYTKEYLNNVSACALRGLVAFSTTLSEDYKTTLRDRFQNPKIVSFFEHNKCMDIETIAEDMGKAIANAMGYSKDSALYPMLVQDFGKHAVALLHLAGYINVQRMNRETGALSSINSKDISNTIVVVTLQDKGDVLRTKVKELDQYEDSTGGRNSILSQLLGLENNVVAPKTEEGFKKDQKKLQEEFSETDAETLYDKDNVKLYHDKESGILKLIDDGDEIYYRDKLLYKKDHTKVSNLRAVQLLRGINQPPLLDMKLTKAMFADVIDFNSNTLKFTEKDFQTKELLAKLVENNPKLRLLINYENPMEIGEPYRTYTHEKNYQALRALLDTANFIIGLNKKSPNAEHIKLYFDEYNTVNNRFFVNATILNYRENKLFRNLFILNEGTNDSIFTIGNENSANLTYNSHGLVHGTIKASNVFLPILAGLDTKWDKLNDDARTNLWTNIAKNKKFSEIVELFEYPNNLDWDTINKSIEEFNTKDENKITYSYFQGGEEVTKRVKLDINNHEVFYTLVKLAQVNITTTSDDGSIFTRRAYNNLTKLTENDTKVSNYTLRIEVDGINNGGAIKGIISNMGVTGDPYSIILTEASGISSYFTNYTDILNTGLLDNYLYAGALSQFKIAREQLFKSIYDNYRTNPLFGFLQELYKEDALGNAITVNDIIETLSEILTRDLMKPPVMTTGYDAGMASVVLKLLNEFNKQFATVRIYSDLKGEAKFKQLVQKAIEQNGGSLRVYIGTQEYFLDSNFNLNGDKDRNILKRKDLRENLIIRLEDNVLGTKLKDNVLSKIYESAKEAVEPARVILENNNKATMAHAKAYNDVLNTLISRELEGKEFTDKEEIFRKVKDISDMLIQLFNPIIGFADDVENQMSGYTLNTFKDSITQDVLLAIRARTLIKDDKFIISNKYKVGYKEALGAGQSPMTAHSDDSYTMTNFADLLQRTGYGKGLPIHDAIVAEIQQLSKLSELNGMFFNLVYNTAISSVARDNSMRTAMSFLEVNRNQGLNLGDSLVDSLKAIYGKTLNITSTHTTTHVLYAGLINLKKIQSYLEKDATKEQAKMIVNQYYLGEDSKYEPSKEEVNSLIKLYEDLLKEADSQTILMDNFVTALKEFADTQSEAIRTILFTKSKQELNKDIASSTSVEEAIQKAYSRIKEHLNAMSEDTFRDEINKRINKNTESSLSQLVRETSDKYATNIDKATQQLSRVNELFTRIGKNNTKDAIEGIWRLFHYFINTYHDLGDHDKSLIINELNVKAYIALAISRRSLDFKDSMSPMDMLDIAQEAVAIAINSDHCSTLLSKSQIDAFNKIVASIPPTFIDSAGNIEFSEFNKDKLTYIDYSDNLNFEEVVKDIEARVNKDIINNVSNPTTVRKEMLKLLATLGRDFDKKYAGQDCQVVFTLKSKTDLLRIQLLKFLKATDKAYKNVNIVIMPALTDITDHAPSVDKEVEFLRRLENMVTDKNKFKSSYLRSTVPSSNSNLLSALTDQDVSQDNIIDGAHNTRVEIPIVSNDFLPGNIERYKLKPVDSKVTFINEVGEVITDFDANDSNQILPIVALDRGDISKRSSQLINYEDITLDIEQNKSDVSNSNDFKVYSNILMGTDRNLEELLAKGNSAIGIDITSDGFPVCSNLNTLRKHVPALNKALSNVQATLRDDYNKYLRGSDRYTWDNYLKPRVMKIVDGGVTNYFVFTITHDTSVTKDELSTSIARKEYGNGLELIYGTNFTRWLSRGETVFQDKAIKFASSHINSSLRGDKRVIIPRDLIDPNTLQMRTETEEQVYFNARCLKKVQNFLGSIGIESVNYLYTNDQVNRNTSIIMPSGLPGKADFYKAISLDRINTHTAKGFGENLAIYKRSLTEDIVDSLTTMAKTPVSFVSNLISRGKKANGVVATDTHHMTGYDTSDPRYTQLTEMNNDNIRFTDAIDQCKEIDRQNGVDTGDGELGWFDTMMRDTTTPILVYMNNSGTVRTSSIALMKDKNTGMSLYHQMNLGRANRGESQIEAIRHEYAHTVWMHATPEVKKELQILFKIWLKHKSMSDFEDGDTLANRMIIDAITNKKTQDPLNEFATYAMTNLKFRQSLRNMQNRVGKDAFKDSIVTKITNLFKSIIEKIAGFINGTYVPSNASEMQSITSAIDDLFRVTYKVTAKYWQESAGTLEIYRSRRNGEVQLTKVNSLDSPEGNFIAREFNANKTNNLTTKLQDTLAKVLMLGDSRAIRRSLANGSLDASSSLIEFAREYLDERDNAIKGIAEDILGVVEGASPDMYKYLQLRNQGKMLIDQQRERSSTAVNNVVKEILKDIPKELEEKLTDYLIRTDISCLFESTKSPEDVHKLLTDKETRKKEITKLENTLKGNTFGNFYINASRGLAQYLTTGFNPTGLAYRNAYEIASLAGSGHQQTTDYYGPLVRTIDQLVTLYSVDRLPDTELYTKLNAGVINQLSALHNGIKKAEFETVYGNSQQKYHIPKGQLHGGSTNGRYDIVPEEQLKALMWNGYEKVDDAKLDPFYKDIAGNNKYVIVQAKHKSPTPYTAGILTMTDIFMGRNKTGISWNGEGKVDKEINFHRTAEYKKLQEYVNQRISALNKPNPQLIKDETHGNLVLNFNFRGKLHGSNFELNPIVTDINIGRNRKITSVLGDIYGSTVERSQSSNYNVKAGEAMIEIYEKAEKESKVKDFEWISDSSEKEEYRNFYESLPLETRDACTKKYGNKGIPVMKKAITTVLGYTNLSANDKKATIEAQEAMNSMSTSFLNFAKYVFHNKWIGNAEEFFVWLTNVGKDNILIKGITTSWNNLLSNCVTLGMNDLNIKDVAKYQAEAFTHMRSVHEWQVDLHQLDVKKLNKTYTNEDAILERTLRTNIEKSPIYPLIKRGIISNSLAEDLTESDKFLKDLIDKVTSKGIVRDVAQTLALTPKSKIYQAMMLFASAGDSVAKYSLYKSLREKGFSEEEACREALQTFIDYSNPLPKSIAYLDHIGVLPFAKYTFASQSSILNTLVKHPNRALGFILMNSMFLGLPNIFEGIFSPTVLSHKMNLPGELFLDSINQLPSVRITNTFSELI